MFLFLCLLKASVRLRHLFYNELNLSYVSTIFLMTSSLFIGEKFFLFYTYFHVIYHF
jgi:hypothetical protein